MGKYTNNRGKILVNSMGIQRQIKENVELIMKYAKISTGKIQEKQWTNTAKQWGTITENTETYGQHILKMQCTG